MKYTIVSYSKKNESATILKKKYKTRAEALKKKKKLESTKKNRNFDVLKF